jgi:predicted transcriptional regulator/transcriptional regulator with XRE-family HTH domain
MAQSMTRLGGKLRRLRQSQKLTQAQMAEALGLSASYLNLLEHNQRAVTVPVLLKLAQRFGVEITDFTADDDGRLASDLMEVFADPLFDGHDLKTADVEELVGAAPALGKAVLTLYQAFRAGGSATAAPGSGLGDEGDTTMPVGMPPEEVTDFIQDRKNYFKELEAAADALWSQAALTPDALYSGLVQHLNEAYAVDVIIAPASGVLRQYDPRTRKLVLSELLPRASRTFQLAHQIALLGHRPLLDRLVSGGKFTTQEADTLARVALANYFAAALVMPYDRFLAAARETRHDIETLERRFDTSFEQVCHRLTSLRRPGQQGVPFHFLRVDGAGNISKRFSASGIAIARFGGACPRWNVYDAFSTPGLLRRQVSRMPEGASFFCVARTVDGAGRSTVRGNNARGGGRHAIGLGCAVTYAREVVYTDGLDLDDPHLITPIGVSCRVCPRKDCADRAHPSLHHPLSLDENRRALATYMSPEG